MKTGLSDGWVGEMLKSSLFALGLRQSLCSTVSRQFKVANSKLRQIKVAMVKVRVRVYFFELSSLNLRLFELSQNLAPSLLEKIDDMKD